MDESYLSKILSAQRPNPRFPVIVRLATALDLPPNLVYELLQASYDSYNLEIPIDVLSKESSQHQFLGYLEQILDALEQSDFPTVSHLNDEICRKVPDSIHLKSNYLCWYNAVNLTFQNKFKFSIPIFIEASKFSPRYGIEKRFKAKILGGLGAAYTARGEYHKSMKNFRQSLLLWSEGFQAAWVFMNMGTLYRRLRRYDLSVSAYKYTYDRGTAVTKLYALVGLIQLSLDIKDYDAARKYVLKGFRHAKTFDFSRGKAELYCNIAEYYSATGKFHRSKIFFQRAILFADISRTPRTKHWAEIELAVLQLERGLVKEFNAVMKTLESELSGAEDVLLVAKHLNALGQKYLGKREYLRVVCIGEKTYKLLTFISPPPFAEFKKCCELLYKANSVLRIPQKANFYLNELKRFNPK